MERQVRISILWLVLMAGGLVHPVVEVMPLFWGESIAAMPQNEAQMHGMMAFSACFFFVLPGLGQLCTLYACKRWCAVLNAVLAGVMLLLNTSHPIMDLPGAPLAQWFILPLVFLFNVILMVEVVKACRRKETHSCCAA